jgi:hypothetical protein
VAVEYLPDVERLGLVGLTPVDIVARHLAAAIAANLGRLVSREEVHRLMGRCGVPLKARPGMSSASLVGGLMQTVAGLLKERRPIHNAGRIHAAVVDGAGSGLGLEAVLHELRHDPSFGPRSLDGAALGSDLPPPSRPSVPPPDRQTRSRRRADRPAATHAPRAGNPVSVALGIELPAAGAIEPKWQRRFKNRLSQSIQDLLIALGLPLAVRIEVTCAPPAAGASHAVRIDGRLCRVRRGEKGRRSSGASETADDVFSSVFQNRELFVTDALIAAMAPGSSGPREHADSVMLLTAALRHGIAIDRLLPAWDAARAAAPAGREAALELLLADLSAPELVVRVAPERYDALAESPSTENRRPADAMLEQLRLDLFWEHGFWVPTLTLRADPALQDGEVALQLNDAPTPPWRLVAGISAEETETTSARHRAIRRQVVEEVRPFAHLLLHMGMVEQMLAELADDRFLPNTVTDLLEELDVSAYLQVLRGLVRERCSIRDQRAIVEAVLATCAPWGGRADPSSPVSIAALVEEARRALAPQLCFQHTRQQEGRAMLPALLLEPATADRLVEAGEEGLPAAEWSRLLDAVQAALDKGGGFGRPPVLMTDTPARAGLRRHIELEFPDLAVLSERELVAGTERQVLATIGV